MGVTHLYTTLRPFTYLDILDGDVVTIDGPALAYHVLHVCRANGVNLPSYCLLGRVVISWLDQLVLHGISIRCIYFDGYLPESKLEVRIGRMKRLATQLSNVYGSTIQGCPASYLVQDGKEPDFDFFKVDAQGSRTLIDPCFLVPAIIDALREHKSYKSITQLVPGEADHFCAGDVCERGGTILTSDSDLLVHNLKHGRIAFFRDLGEDHMSRITFTNFKPERIFETIGLRYPEKALQLAYERQLSPHASLSQIVLKASRPLLQSAAYLSFQEQFASLEISNLLERGGCKLPSLNSSDPRISEMVIAFYLLRQRESAHLPIRMFLPPLMECPVLKSAWDPSTPIRQLAYTFASYFTTSRDDVSVHEFRRVQTLSSSGREVRPVSFSLAKRRVGDIMSHMQEMKGSYDYSDHRFWIALGMVLEISESQRQGRTSVVPTIYERFQSPGPAKPGTHVAWADVHIFAQIQGILYSFRILQQVLASFGHEHLEHGLIDFDEIRGILSQLTPLAQFPSVHDTFETVQELCQSEILRNLIGSIATTRAGDARNNSVVFHIENEALDENPSVDCVASDSRALYKNNMFSSLSIE